MSPSPLGVRPAASPPAPTASSPPPAAAPPAAPAATTSPAPAASPPAPPAVTVVRPIDIGAPSSRAVADEPSPITRPATDAPDPAGARPVDAAGATSRPRPPAPGITVGPPAMTAPVAVGPAKAAPSPEPVGPAPPSPQAFPPPEETLRALPADPALFAAPRPAAPQMAQAPGTPVSIADTFERLLSAEVDAGFASLERPSRAPPATAAIAPTDIAEVRALFAQLAANHVRPVRDFVIDLRWSDATVDWLPICTPALRSLRRAADKLDLTVLCSALDRFAEALAAAQSGDGRTIGGSLREELLARYEELSREMPQAFALDLDRTVREGVILQSLLLQVPEVKKVTLDKMYAAGLSTLEALTLATPADVAATTGISEALAERILARFRAYREQVVSTVPDASRARERERIAELTARLRAEHDAYERTSLAWSREADDKKKELRKARAKTLLDIQVELARLGEVERLERLERLPFEGKLTQLESFLEDARDKYVAQT